MVAGRQPTVATSPLSAAVLSFATPPDFEKPADAGRNNVYQVTVRATAGSHTIEQDVTIRVTGVDEPPTLMGPTSVPPYDENRTTRVAAFTATDPEGATVIWSVTGTDDDDFDHQQRCPELQQSAPNYEARADADGDNDYEVTVVASDGTTSPRDAGPHRHRQQPGRSGQPDAVFGAAGGRCRVDRHPERPRRSLRLLIWVWERSSDRSTWTEINGADSDRYTPVTDDMNNYLRARVTYTDGHGEPGSKSLQRDGHQPGTGRAGQQQLPAVLGRHHDPHCPGEYESRESRWRPGSGHRLGRRPADLYALGRRRRFVYHRQYWPTESAVGTRLDHETQASYFVTVRATDPSQASGSIFVTIEGDRCG